MQTLSVAHLARTSGGSNGDFELCDGTAAALGVVRGGAEGRSLRMRCDAPPQASVTRLGQTTISHMSLSGFEAVLPDTCRTGRREWMTILLQCRGSTRFENEDHAGVSTRGQIVIFDSNKQTAICSGEPSARMVATFPKAALPAPVLKRLDRIVHFVEPGPGFPDIFSTFLRAAFRNAHALATSERLQVDRALLCTVVDLLGTCGETPTGKGVLTLGQIRERALHLIEADIAGVTSATELAKRVGCSRRYLFDAFQDVGLAPGRYIRATRLKRARIAIETTSDVSIAEISYALGFESYPHFSKLFKRTFGVSPQSLRGVSG